MDTSPRNTTRPKDTIQKIGIINPVNIPPHFEEYLQQIGITNLETIPTKLAAAYLTQLKGVPTAPSSLEVYRCTSRGPRYKKIGSRVFYTSAWLDEWAQGVEVRIYDPSRVVGK